MDPQAELQRARSLIFAAQGETAYLVRTAYNGTEECIRRIDDCLAVYRSIRAGTDPEQLRE